MSKERYEWYMGTSEIIDNKTKKFITQNCTELLNQQSQQIADLEAKLAEKDRQIEQLKKFDNLNKTFFDLLRTAFKEPNKIDDLFNTLKTMQEKQDQDKISFCIEWLEKVKDIISWKPPLQSYEEIIKTFHFRIDNLINELKEMK